jgi:ABC-type Mn2+/Zn2+ transport system ATPase subunit
VLIARALAGEPEVLLLDEPTAAVDAASRRLLDTVLAEVNREIPVVVVTHDPSAIASRVTRVALVDRASPGCRPKRSTISTATTTSPSARRAKRDRRAEPRRGARPALRAERASRSPSSPACSAACSVSSW